MIVDSKEKIVIEINKDTALILFEWLARVNSVGQETADQSERISLCDLEATLEEVLVEPFLENYREIIAQAKSRVICGTQLHDSDQEMELGKAKILGELPPKDVRGYLERAKVHGQHGRFQEQLADLSIAIQLQSSERENFGLLCESYFARGLTHQLLENHEEAILDFNSAFKLDKNYCSVLKARAFSFIQTKQLNLASQDLIRAMELSPNDSHVMEMRKQIGESGARNRFG